jgi:hypothetical protein
MIKEENYSIILGTVLLVVGMIILIFVFTNALDIIENPSEKLEQWVPEEIEGPQAIFMWGSNDKSIEFIDSSTEGSSDIIKWRWDFGDGKTNNEKNPSYEYSDYNIFTVTLEVEDENGKTDATTTKIPVSKDESNEGTTQTSLSFDLGLESTFNKMIISLLYVGAFIILVMIGGKILIAGCQLIRPSVKIFRIKGKEKEKEIISIKDNKDKNKK